MSNTVVVNRTDAFTSRPATTPAQTGQRLVSLDVFRGITIAAMILVNNGGDSQHTYWPLEHSRWNGWTPTDLVFPFFLFIVGLSMVLSFGSRLSKGYTRRKLMLHALKRSAIIFALGVFLYAYPNFDWHTARVPGVLQRIAVTYLITSILYLYASRTVRYVLSAFLLLAYWLVLTRIPVPGYGAGVLTIDGNLVGYIDRSLLYNHLWIAHRFDPEGILSTLPSIVTCLLGLFTGEWMRSARTPLRKIAGMAGAGVAAIIAGEIWNLWFPINKSIWTSSFVLLTAGLALIGFAACYWLIDVRGKRAWGRPFEVFGVNPLAIYFLASWAETASYHHHIHGESIKTFLYNRFIAPLFANPYHASLFWGLSYVVLFFLIAWMMYRKRIFIRL